MQLGYQLQSTAIILAVISSSLEKMKLYRTRGRARVWQGLFSLLGISFLTYPGFGDCSQKTMVFPATVNPALLQGRSQSGSGRCEFPPVLSAIVVHLKPASIFLNVGRKFYSDFFVPLSPNRGQ